MLVNRSGIVALKDPAGNTSPGIAPCPDARRRWIATLIAQNSMARRQARPLGKTTISTTATSGLWVASSSCGLLSPEGHLARSAATCSGGSSSVEG